MANMIKYFGLLLFFGSIFFHVEQGYSEGVNLQSNPEESSGNIAVAAVGDHPESEISMNAGRASHYLIFDEQGVLLKTIENPALNSRGGASGIVVDLLLKESCNIIIAGNFGEKMQAQLRANQISGHIFEGIVKEVLKKFLEQ